ncbi:hypothetical protein V8J88_04820 [Massilia sp. W12]|uniref:hypothetical protein n=1 Tax=Massilia sp. W12 TaxID=3126507 RepID=UPI0030CB729B
MEIIFAQRRAANPAHPIAGRIHPLGAQRKKKRHPQMPFDLPPKTDYGVKLPVSDMPL